MNTLVINCGSSSVKCRIYSGDEGQEPQLLASGSVAPIGHATSQLHCQAGDHKETASLENASYDSALEALCSAMLSLCFGRDAREEIAAVGHRVVHGGERFRSAVEVDDSVEREIEALIPLAPMHNPLCLIGIRAARKRFTKAKHVAVFDTAFHQTLPEEAFLYALPHDMYSELGIRRYGFHGSSHQSVSTRAIEMLDRVGQSSRVIVCHLGAGCSTSAVRDGKSIDTSMGMTPLEGLVMATRSGDVDPGVLIYLARERGMSLDEVESQLLNESGLLGISGLTGEIRDLTQLANDGNERADLALRVFSYRVRKYIGAHMAVLGGADAVVFTGGAGENSPDLRARILTGLDGLGVQLDPAANAACIGEERVISQPGSAVAVYVIGSNEERAIANATLTVLAESL
ncbi:MAG: acetate kinase [Myxococcota bacterium]